MKIKVSEVFGPAGYWTYVQNEDGTLTSTFTERWGVTQGEGKYVGQRSVFVRVFGCNFTCPGFGLPKGCKTEEPQLIANNIHLYKSVAELPAAQYGCDSYYSVYPEFKNLSPMLDTEELATQILRAAGGTFFSGCNPIHLIFTGGEPMLGWQRAYPELIEKIKQQDKEWTWGILPVTIETNGTKPLETPKDNPDMYHMEWVAMNCNITWSVSPKLSASGHTAEEAIKPEVLSKYLTVSNDMYLKFVVQDVSDFDEVDSAVSKYVAAGVECPVYIMPEGGTPGEFQKHATLELTAEAVKRGYNVTTRLHVLVGGNNVGW